jgi:hypothetical protein
MRQIGFALCVFALLSPPQANAQAPADFAGTWKMDLSRSDSAHQAVPIGPVTLTIKQTANDLSIATRRAQKQKPAFTTERLMFKLDGSETSTAGSPETTVKTKAHWEGASLVTETTRNIDGSTVTTMHVFSLDPSGKELTVDKTLTIQHGYQFPGAANTGKGKDFFVRSSGPARK